MKNTVLILAFIMCFTGCQMIPGRNAGTFVPEIKTPAPQRQAERAIQEEIRQSAPQIQTVGITQPTPQRQAVEEMRPTPPPVQDTNAQRTATLDLDDNPTRAFNAHSSRPDYDSLRIIGTGTITANDVIRYVGRSAVIDEGEIRRLIRTYINEARDEGVNHDIAIAQMLHVTHDLTRTGILTGRNRTNNFGGLNSKDVRGWNGSFPTMEEGVRAHIQHLRGYARQNLTGVNRNINPRWDMISHIRGKRQTLGELYRNWSPHNTDAYRWSINSILNDLYR